jgi:hypothetical protein
MSDSRKTISPLRRRMIEDMEVRGFAPKTQTGYIRAIRNFTVFSASHRIRRIRRICDVSSIT